MNPFRPPFSNDTDVTQYTISSPQSFSIEYQEAEPSELLDSLDPDALKTGQLFSPMTQIITQVSEREDFDYNPVLQELQFLQSELMDLDSKLSQTSRLAHEHACSRTQLFHRILDVQSLFETYNSPSGDFCGCKCNII